MTLQFQFLIPTESSTSSLLLPCSIDSHFKSTIFLFQIHQITNLKTSNVIFFATFMGNHHTPHASIYLVYPNWHHSWIVYNTTIEHIENRRLSEWCAASHKIPTKKPKRRKVHFSYYSGYVYIRRMVWLFGCYTNSILNSSTPTKVTLNIFSFFNFMTRLIPVMKKYSSCSSYFFFVSLC